jgi:hypothetical protein
MNSTNSTITMGFDFGDANDYWQFVDQGVEGIGGAGQGRTAKGKQSARGGTGVARGKGSPFKFNPQWPSPKGDLVTAIRGWIKNKPISLRDGNEIGAAFSIGYSIKRRGLERTMFYTRPVTKALKTLPDELTEAFRLDFSKVVDKLPSKILIETKE